ncbi:HAD family hydrolase [Kitasatospora sp. NPDC096147]|uniref:HAD family hydrolase n=1 Tax=Kitasatospora sp. NPDC096147 TaxID=3364093 RepID=UPI0038079560
MTPAPQPPLAPAPFDAVLCDFDGVIRHFDQSAVAVLERSAGLAEGSTYAAAFAPEHAQPLILGRLTRAEWTDRIAVSLTVHTPGPTARALAAAFTTTPVHADPDVVALLREVRRRVPLVLVTNGTPWTDQGLTDLALTDLAHHVVNSARLGIAKPDPGIYHHAATLVGAAPDRCLFIDDSPKNVTAATALGMTAHHYRTPAGLATALAPLLG